MPTLHCAGQDCPVRPGETVLDCLLRHRIAVPHSCKAGACQTCLMRATSGVVPEAAQQGLRDTLRAQNYFLACSCEPAEDLTVILGGTAQRSAARIVSLKPLNETVLRVRLVFEAEFAYRPGQFATLLREDGLARSYSLASLPHETELELHVRLIPGGAMSGWLRQTALPGTPVWLQGPAGNCFYVPGAAGEPLLLAGAGTGLAPLYGIVRDALRQGHTGEIHLFHGALTTAGLYLTSELLALAQEHTNFHYVRSVLHGDASPASPEVDHPEVEQGELAHSILSRFPKLGGWKGYICGDPALVTMLKKKVFLAGMASKAIYADAFLPSA